MYVTLCIQSYLLWYTKKVDHLHNKSSSYSKGKVVYRDKAKAVAIAKEKWFTESMPFRWSVL